MIRLNSRFFNTAAAYRAIIFLAAFLLFSVQPIIAKYILPWFGGSQSVWVTALLFFQVFLFTGYVFAATVSRLGARGQLIGYCAVILLSLLLLPITPDAALRPINETNPAMRILLLLTLTVGVPYFILAATSPLIQAWASSGKVTEAPYRLYVWSNAGSLLGLLLYPVLVEPLLTVQQQTFIWSFAFAVFGIGVIALSLQWYRHVARATAVSQTKSETEKPPRPTMQQRFLWLLLPFLASTALLAVTNYITQDIASIPFLWILPLSVYLLSFIITFNGDRVYDRRFFAQLFLYASILGAFVVLLGSNILNVFLILLILVILGVYCVVCHGELYARRPDPRRLTSFYLWVSFGGALGGVFVGLVAPMVFPLHFEYHVSLGLGLLVMLFLWVTRDTPTLSYRSFLTSKAGYGVIALFVVGALAYNIYDTVSTPTYLHRDFFGSLRVFETPDARTLQHGRILHGMQFTADNLACWPTTYYGHTSGLGKAITIIQPNADSPLRLGVVGLGVGTAVVYGDYVRFYELNPAVKGVAETKFTYLSQCGHNTDIILGDGRLSLEREEAQGFDVLVLDAFNSDAIPVHLLTIEAFKTYIRHLAPSGIIAVHISNNHINLKPVIGAAAHELDFFAAVLEDDGNWQQGTSASTWVLMGTNKNFFETLKRSGIATPEATAFTKPVLWTDAYSNIFTLLQLK